MKRDTETSAMTRRHFLRSGAAAVAAFTILPRHVFGGPNFVAPSEKVNIAIVGAGGQGRTNVRALLAEKDAQIIGVADPIEEHDLTPFYYKGSAGRKPVKAEIEKHYGESKPDYRCAEYEDFRVMLEKEKAIDAILCATPDHNHAYVTITAMKAGKHTYCEKPLTHNVWEARQVAKVAKETGVATQMGNQGHSGDGIRTTCEWIWDGAIGEIRQVHAWTKAGRWGKEIGGRPKETPMPGGVNWDLWIGTRQPRPYSSAYTPVTWRDFWAFGSAPIGDMACHNLDPAFWALDLAEPLSIEASCPGTVDEEMCPFGSIYRYKFGPRKQLPPVEVTWYDGGLLPGRPEELEDDDQLGQSGNGIIFVGSKGKIMCPGWGGAPKLLPIGLMDSYQKPAKTLPRSKGHHRDWLEACKGGPAPSASFAYGAKLTEVVLLGNVALRVGKKIEWDSVNMKAKNAPEADQYLKETYRQGWEVVA
ncbi:MAG: Gfo/Idh/MocA family oxidoreductase [Verrucomicrobiota bacterium]